MTEEAIRSAAARCLRGERHAVTALHYRMPQRILWLLVSLTLFWGFNWPVVKTVLTAMSPLYFRSWGMAVGAACLFAMAKLGGLPIRVPRGCWGRLAAISMLNLGVWNVLTAYGIPLMDSGRAAILAYTFPVFSVLFSLWLLKERLTRRRVAGLALGIAGLALLMGSELTAVGRSPLGALLLLVSAAVWALGAVVMKRWPVDLPATSFAAWQMALVFVPIFLCAVFFEGGGFSPLRLPLWPFLGFLFSVFVCGGFGNWAWIKIVMGAPETISTLCTLMVPVVGVFSGMLALSERPQWTDYAALVLVIMAVASVLIPPRGAAQAGKPDF